MNRIILKPLNDIRMRKEKDKISERMDALIDEALQEAPQIPVPPGFPEKVMARIEKQSYLREIVQEAYLKAGLVAGLIFVLLASLMITGFISLRQIGHFIGQYIPIITAISFIILFTWLLNDVALKYVLGKKGLPRNGI